MSQAGIFVPPPQPISPTIPTSFVTDAGTAVPALNVLQVLGGTDITTSGAGNTILITFTGAPGLTWNVVTSANNPVTLVTQNAYIAKGALPVNFVLPAGAAVGDIYRIVGYGNLWTLSQNAGQSITIGFVTSTVGIGGSLQATMISDGIELVCVTTNLEFFEIGIQGNIKII